METAPSESVFEEPMRMTSTGRGSAALSRRCTSLAGETILISRTASKAPCKSSQSIMGRLATITLMTPVGVLSSVTRFMSVSSRGLVAQLRKSSHLQR